MQVVFSLKKISIKSNLTKYLFFGEKHVYGKIVKTCDVRNISLVYYYFDNKIKENAYIACRCTHVKCLALYGITLITHKLQKRWRKLRTGLKAKGTDEISLKREEKQNR